MIAANSSGCVFWEAVKEVIAGDAPKSAIVSHNRLHAGSNTTSGTLGRKEFKNGGAVNYTYTTQPGDQIVKIIGIITISMLFAFIAYRFFRFLRRFVDKCFFIITYFVRPIPSSGFCRFRSLHLLE